MPRFLEHYKRTMQPGKKTWQHCYNLGCFLHLTIIQMRHARTFINATLFSFQLTLRCRSFLHILKSSRVPLHQRETNLQDRRARPLSRKHSATRPYRLPVAGSRPGGGIFKSILYVPKGVGLTAGANRQRNPAISQRTVKLPRTGKKP